MDVLYVLIPLSVVLVFFVLGARLGHLSGPVRGCGTRGAAYSRERLTHVNVSMTQLRILLCG